MHWSGMRNAVDALACRPPPPVPRPPQAYAEELVAQDEREAHRITDERKKRNYSDFWVPAAVTEPFRVVLSHMRDKLFVTREVSPFVRCWPRGVNRVKGGCRTRQDKCLYSA